MGQKTFAEATHDLHAALEQAQIPQPIAAHILELHRGPYSHAEALRATIEYYTTPMRPDSPVIWRLEDLAGLFRQSAEDWKVSINALEQLQGYVAHPERIQLTVECGRLGDWQKLREAYSNGLPQEQKTALLQSFDEVAALASNGKILEVYDKTSRTAAQAATLNAAVFAGMETPHPLRHDEDDLGYDTTTQRRVSEAAGWGGAAATSGIVGSVVTGCVGWAAYNAPASTAFTVGSTAVTYAGLAWAATAGLGLATVGFTGYYLYRMYHP